MSATAVRAEGLAKRFGAVRAVDGMDFAVAPGQVLALLGPSGCGKTTALRLVAGFERPDGGRVEIEGQTVAGPGVYVPPEGRRVGMVFQDYALFPHLTVAQNVAFGLPRSAERRARVEALLSRVGLAGLGQRWPHELSGGQQQRVALARALAPQPRVLLLDEPFSNLDAELRARVRVEVRALLQETGVTAIFVTHDREEALSLADAVAVVQAGRILQVAAPDALYRLPASPAVAAAVGDADFIDATAQGATATCELGSVPLARPAEGPVRLLVRPEQLCVQPDPAGTAVVGGREYYGRDQLVVLRLPSGTTLRARLPADQPLAAGAAVTARLRSPLLAFPSAEG
jgi:iron(III) transport system ATP-binding protein